MDTIAAMLAVLAFMMRFALTLGVETTPYGYQLGSPWPARTTRRTDSVLVKTWTFGTGGDVFSSPAIDKDGNVFVGSWDDNLYKINGTTGTKIWSFATGSHVESSPTIDKDGNVFVGSDDNNLYKINGATGTKIWSFATDKGAFSSPAIDKDGNVFVGSWDGNLYKINGATGTKSWSFTTDGGFYSSPAIDKDGNVFVGSRDYNLYKINGATGTKIWSFATGSYVDSSPAIDKDGNVFVGSADKYLYKINGATGTKIWSFSTGSYVDSSPAIDKDGNVFVGSGDKNLYKFSPICAEYGLYYYDSETSSCEQRCSVRNASAYFDDYIGVPEVKAQECLYCPSSSTPDEKRTTCHCENGLFDQATNTCTSCPERASVSPDRSTCVCEDGVIHTGSCMSRFQAWVLDHPLEADILSSVGPAVLIGLLIVVIRSRSSSIGTYELTIVWFALVDFLGDVLYISTQEFYTEWLFYVSTGLLFAPPLLFTLVTWRYWLKICLDIVSKSRRDTLRYISLFGKLDFNDSDVDEKCDQKSYVDKLVVYIPFQLFAVAHFSRERLIDTFDKLVDMVETEEVQKSEKVQTSEEVQKSETSEVRKSETSEEVQKSEVQSDEAPISTWAIAKSHMSGILFVMRPFDALTLDMHEYDASDEPYKVLHVSLIWILNSVVLCVGEVVLFVSLLVLLVLVVLAMVFVFLSLLVALSVQPIIFFPYLILPILSFIPTGIVIGILLSMYLISMVLAMISMITLLSITVVLRIAMSVIGIALIPLVIFLMVNLKLTVNRNEDRGGKSPYWFNLSVFVEILGESIPQLAIITANTVLLGGEKNGIFYFAIIGSILSIANAVYFHVYWWVRTGSLIVALKMDPREDSDVNGEAALKMASFGREAIIVVDEHV